MAEPDYQEIRRTPATVWQALTKDYDSLVTGYDWVFTMDWDKTSTRAEGVIRRDWEYQTYILLTNGGRKELGRNTNRIQALRFHEEMAVKHGFF